MTELESDGKLNVHWMFTESRQLFTEAGQLFTESRQLFSDGLTRHLGPCSVAPVMYRNTNLGGEYTVINLDGKHCSLAYDPQKRTSTWP
jgi:hypothetical protein